jgi:hypothetical protein
MDHITLHIRFKTYSQLGFTDVVAVVAALVVVAVPTPTAAAAAAGSLDSTDPDPRAGLSLDMGLVSLPSDAASDREDRVGDAAWAGAATSAMTRRGFSIAMRIRNPVTKAMRRARS